MKEVKAKPVRFADLGLPLKILVTFGWIAFGLTCLALIFDTLSLLFGI